ncbi:hypothetical protein BAUCODRAFT_169253 [Baudoinia panamericana UAMH 10762]|uniref:rRNA-processing protein EFG1 n=1 Tax=Baudoinia panamericana (strain UAMH 10762) TaxID=717646 RepID=M2N8H3_BAUPA|nr:uncharacterized protein BAUCODRAFT_169253 [Baudoinia panamericana UAMH 10762]EMD00444.1 hypothetical protein BAUCODRAFT_169253 [Baudoinia panamericana UAMH 10762]
MATKRPHSAIHPSRREQVPQDEQPRRKRQKPDHIHGKSFKKAHTVHELRTHIRSLKRLLEHNDDLPADVRVEKERALQTAQHELAETERAKERSDMIGKWHKVRFFERQKASKRLKRARRAVAECEDLAGKVELEARVEEAEVDVNYAMYFPLGMEYVPLFPKRRRRSEGAEGGEGDGGQGVGGDEERQGDQKVWQLVRRCMEDGQLEALRNGKLTGSRAEGDAGSVVTTHKKRAKEKRRAPNVVVEGNRRERRSALAAHADSEAESEGGFFE